MPWYLSRIDTDTIGNRYDVTPLFADHEAFTALVEDLVRPFRDKSIDFVAGIDALGFILGTAISLRLGVGFIPIRKGGKLPVEVDRIEFTDYSGQQKALEVRRDALQPGQRILIVDEWIETGAQVKASIELIERQGAIVVGIATINIDQSPDTAAILEKCIVHSVGGVQ